MPFQNLTSWIGRDPGFHTPAKPSLSALQRVKSLKGVGPDQTPYGDDEMELAFNQQAADVQGQQAEFMQGPRFDLSRGGAQLDPITQRAKAKGIAGGSRAAFMEALQRSSLMAQNRGMRSKIDLVGEGPGTGTGVGRWNAQIGEAGPGGSFRSQTPSIDLDTLADDTRMAPVARDRSRAMQALSSLVRGGR